MVYVFSFIRSSVSPLITFNADLTAVCAISVVAVAFASAVVTGGFEGIETEFHVGEVVTALSVSLMVCGFGIGPLLWSPLVSSFTMSHLKNSPQLLQSELVGRRPVWIIPSAIYVSEYKFSRMRVL